MTRTRPAHRYPTGDLPMLSYLHALDWVLDDAVIDAFEREQLDHLARDLGLDPVDTTRIHSHYLRQLVVAAQRDGIITPAERDLMERVSSALGMDADFIPEVTSLDPPPAIVDGMRVCFTGDAMHWTREELAAAAALVGFQPVGTLTKRGCDLLVAADTDTQSGKADKARQWGIPVVSLSEFVVRIGLR